MVEEADALLLLGVILSDTNFALSQRQLDPRRTMRAFDREVAVGHHVYPDVPIDDLIEALATRARPLGVGRAPAHLRAIEYPRGLKADDNPITPSDIAAAINDLFDRHGPMPMTADIGDCLFTAMEIENTALAAPGYYAGMGFGVPAGIGVAAATGRRPLILVGDGAFQMTGWELGNCRRYGLDPIVVLFNNASWEMLRAFQPESAFQRSRRLAFRGNGAFARRPWRAGATRRELKRRARTRGGAPRPVFADGGHAAARRDVADARAIRVRLQGRQGALERALMALELKAVFRATTDPENDHVARATACGTARHPRACVRCDGGVRARRRAALPRPRARCPTAPSAGYGSLLMLIVAMSSFWIHELRVWGSGARSICCRSSR